MTDQIRTPEEIAPELAVKDKELNYLVAQIIKLQEEIDAFVAGTSQGQLLEKLKEKKARVFDDRTALRFELEEAGIHKWETEHPDDKQMAGGCIAIQTAVEVKDEPHAVTSMLAWGHPECVSLVKGKFNTFARQHPDKVKAFCDVFPTVTFSIKSDLSPWLPPQEESEDE